MNFTPFASQKTLSILKWVRVKKWLMLVISQDTDLVKNSFYITYTTSDTVKHYRMK